MRLGPDHTQLDPSNIPLGWVDGGFPPDGDGVVTVSEGTPDAVNPLGNLVVSHLTVGTRYALVTRLTLDSGMTAAIYGLPTAASFTEGGTIAQSFVAAETGLALTLRVAGAGNCTLGPGIVPQGTTPIPVAICEVLDQ